MKKGISLLLCIIALSPTGTLAAAGTPDAERFAHVLLALQKHGFNEFGSTEEQHSALVTRGAFIRIITSHVFPIDVLDHCLTDLPSSPRSRYTHLFRDVQRDDAFAKHICVALQTGLIQGRADGAFHASEPINLAEGAKILAKAYDLSPLGRVPRRNAPWHEQYIYDLRNRGGIPPHLVDRPAHLLTESDIALMLYGIRSRIARFAEETPPQGWRGTQPPRRLQTRARTGVFAPPLRRRRGSVPLSPAAPPLSREFLP